MANVSAGRNAAALPDRFYWVDGLRGIAAMGVVVFHYHHFYLASATERSGVPPVADQPLGWLLWPIYEHGMFAVQMFWIISGFVFAHVYLHRPTTARDFFAARVARLYPLHLATLLAVAALQAISLRLAGHWQVYGSNDLWHFGLHLAMASNWTTRNIGLSFNGPIWSVSLEVLVYLGFFLALSGIRRFRMALVLPICAGLWALALSGLEPLPLIDAAVYECGGYFFLGSVIYLVIADGRRGLTAGLFAALAALGVFGLAQDQITAAVAGLSSAVVIAAVRLEAGRFQPRRLLAPLGDISYSLYLVHVPLQIAVLVLADTVFGGTRTFADHPALLPAYLVLSVIVAHLAYRHFEKPAGRALRARLSGG